MDFFNASFADWVNFLGMELLASICRAVVFLTAFYIFSKLPFGLRAIARTLAEIQNRRPWVARLTWR